LRHYNVDHRVELILSCLENNPFNARTVMRSTFSLQAICLNEKSWLNQIPESARYMFIKNDCVLNAVAYAIRHEGKTCVILNNHYGYLQPPLSMTEIINTLDKNYQLDKLKRAITQGMNNKQAFISQIEYRMEQLNLSANHYETQNHYPQGYLLNRLGYYHDHADQNSACRELNENSPHPM